MGLSRVDTSRQLGCRRIAEVWIIAILEDAHTGDDRCSSCSTSTGPCATLPPASKVKYRGMGRAGRPRALKGKNHSLTTGRRPGLEQGGWRLRPTRAARRPKAMSPSRCESIRRMTDTLASDLLALFTHSDASRSRVFSSRDTTASCRPVPQPAFVVRTVRSAARDRSLARKLQQRSATQD
jgi:hypothetical protein